VSIAIRNICKNFGQFSALNDVSLEIPTGELTALLGPSGCGKTTLLRIIAGMEVPDSGSIHFHGEDTTHTHTRERRVGFVFQHYALFRHMTVFENVAFGLRVRPKGTRPPEPEIADRVHSLLKLVQLDWLAGRYPSQLSGGQRQRIALARALAVEPKVLLLDEPFGALDARVRKELRRWLRRLHDELHITSVFVTHDQEEALEVADRIVVLNQGRIEQVGSPEEVYDRPASKFVYQFLGDVSLFRGRVHQGRGRIEDFEIDIGGNPQVSADDAHFYVRPHEIDLVRDRNGKGGIEVRVRDIRRIGPIVRVELDRLDGQGIIESELTRERCADLSLNKGEVVFARPQNPRVFLETHNFEI
jgi:sulfate transport system ATP-binding protein